MQSLGNRGTCGQRPSLRRAPLRPRARLRPSRGTGTRSAAQRGPQTTQCACFAVDGEVGLRSAWPRGACPLTAAGGPDVCGREENGDPSDPPTRRGPVEATPRPRGPSPAAGARALGTPRGRSQHAGPDAPRGLTGACTLRTGRGPPAPPTSAAARAQKSRSCDTTSGHASARLPADGSAAATSVARRAEPGGTPRVVLALQQRLTPVTRGPASLPRAQRDRSWAQRTPLPGGDVRQRGRTLPLPRLRVCGQASVPGQRRVSPRTLLTLCGPDLFASALSWAWGPFKCHWPPKDREHLWLLHVPPSACCHHTATAARRAPRRWPSERTTRTPVTRVVCGRVSESRRLRLPAVSKQQRLKPAPEVTIVGLRQATGAPAAHRRPATQGQGHLPRAGPCHAHGEPP